MSIFYGSIFRNHFVSKFTFKTDLGMMIDFAIIQGNIFYDIIKYMLIKQQSKVLNILQPQKIQHSTCQ